MKIEDFQRAAALKTELDEVLGPLAKFRDACRKGSSRRGFFYGKLIEARVVTFLIDEGDERSEPAHDTGSFRIPEDVLVKLMEERESFLIAKLRSLGVEC